MAPVHDPTQRGRLVAGLEDLLTGRLLTDVTLTAGTERVRGHRSVLAAGSTYFRAMFTSELKESTQPEVELHNVPPSLLSPLVGYIYHGTFDITEDNVQDIFTIANLLELVELSDLCAQFMVREIAVANCVALFSLSTTYSHSFIEESARTFIDRHFISISKEGHFNQLVMEDLVSLLRSDCLDIRSEEEVFNCVIAWVNHDVQARKKHLPSLLDVVRLGLLSEDFMSGIVETCDLIRQDPFCRSVISMARLQVVGAGTVDFDNESYRSHKPRYGMYCAELVTFVGGSTKQKIMGVGCFDPKTMKNYYAIQPQLTFDFSNRIDHHRAVATEDGEIFVSGGVMFEDYEVSKSGVSSRDVSLFDPDTCSWMEMDQMNSRRCAHAMVCVDNFIYAIGGKSQYPDTDGAPLSSVERYSIMGDTWRYVADLPEGLYHHQAVVYKDKIFVIGGTKVENQASKKILVFDTKGKQSWEELDVTLEYPRTMHGAAIRQDEVFIAGGTNGDVKLSTVEILNLETQKWSRGEFLPEERISPAMFTFNEEVYLCGGMRTLHMRATGELKEMLSRDLWKYNTKESSWVQVAKLLPYANCHGFCVTEHNFKKITESDFVSKV